VGIPPMLPYRLCASEYSAAIVGINLTHHSVLVHRQLLYGLDDPAGHFQLAGILDQTSPIANSFCYGLGLLSLDGVGVLHMALDLAGQNTMSTLSSHF
jgi:hypothetical protein